MMQFDHLLIIISICKTNNLIFQNRNTFYEKSLTVPAKESLVRSVSCSLNMIMDTLRKIRLQVYKIQIYS